MSGLIKAIKPANLVPTGPLTVQPYQYDHGASIAIVHPKRGVLALIPPTNDRDDPDMHTATREPWDGAYGHLFAHSPDLYAELKNILRCFDRDNIPAFQSGRGGNEGVKTLITHKTAERIRTLLTVTVLPEIKA